MFFFQSVFLLICVKESDVFLCAIELKNFLKESHFLFCNTLRSPLKALFLYSWFSSDPFSVSLFLQNHSGLPLLSYLIKYSCSLLELLSFHSTGVCMIVEYSRSLRTCSPLYLVIQDPQNMNNPPKNSIVSFLSNMIDAILGQRN